MNMFGLLVCLCVSILAAGVSQALDAESNFLRTLDPVFLDQLESELAERIEAKIFARLEIKTAAEQNEERKALLARIEDLEARDKARTVEIADLRQQCQEQRMKVPERHTGVNNISLPHVNLHSSRLRQVNNEAPVAFFATIANSVSHAGVHQTYVFDNVITNVGNAYDSSNGNFKAPVAGIYVFSVTLMSQYHTNAHAQFIRNGQYVSKLYVSGTTAGYDTTSQTIVLDLEKGDDTCIHNIDSDSSMAGIHYSSFAGFLLQENLSSQTIIGK